MADEINVPEMHFIDLNPEKYGSFIDRENTEKFMGTELGKAQLALIEEEVNEQGFDGDLTEEQKRLILGHAQIYQGSEDEYIRPKNISEEELLDGYNMIERAYDHLAGKFNEAVDGVGNLFNNNGLGSGMADEARRDLEGHNKRTEAVIKGLDM